MDNKKILVTGGSGLVGKSIEADFKLLSDKNSFNFLNSFILLVDI